MTEEKIINKPNNNRKRRQYFNNNSKNKSATSKPTLKIIPLGGVGEIGKSLTLFECNDDIIIVDVGLKFPDENMYGIDGVIPDFSYVIEKKDKIRGIFLTHGHEDHIGGLPYLLKQVSFPIYGTKLTIGLLESKLAEHNLEKSAKLNIIKYGDVVNVKGFSVEFITTNHSIADSSALYIKSKGGNVFHTGDFKVDYTPIDNQRIDLQRFAQIGNEGVDVLLADSTNAERPGFTRSEAEVGKSFMSIFKGVKKRIIIATFSTNIHRIQQIFDTAKHYKRKVAISGRSMINVTNVAKQLKYLKFKESILIDISEIDNYPPEQVVLLTTGSQGEPLAALSRMARNEHRQMKISQEDFVIISATPIPGNEKTVAQVINELFKLGAEVVYQGSQDVHVSGHACAEELKLIHTLVKAKYFVPVHGEYKMLASHADIAVQTGMKKENVFLLEIGDVLEISEKGAKVTGSVPSGITLIDGLGIGDVGNIVLKDRKKLSEDGLFIIVTALTKEQVVSGPDIISRGFVYMRESEDLLSDAKKIAENVLNKYCEKLYDYNAIKNEMKNELERYLFEQTKRKPMILPVLMYVK